MRIGVLFAFHDLLEITKRGIDRVVIVPGTDFDENDVKTVTSLPCTNLTDFLEKGEISELSRKTATFIRNIMTSITGPTEALACQNDLYQYHLRTQFLLLTALERYLATVNNYTLVFQTRRYNRYYTPMRPDIGLFYESKRTLAYLSSQLATLNGEESEFIGDFLPGFVRSKADYVVLKLRSYILNVFMILKLCQKTLLSQFKRNFGNEYIQTPSKIKNDDKDKPIGIIVRTDSEVISASFIVDRLKSINMASVVIQDEILASTSTVARLEALGLKYLPIGSMRGTRGLMSAFLFRKKLSISESALIETPSEVNYLTQSERVLADDPHVITELKSRLLDFYLTQKNFEIELSAMITELNIARLVTFAYVDQWGGIIKSVGDSHDIETIAVQNAAQDPEEYPRLCWADHYCVESLYLKERLVSLGYPQSKITGTGLPHYSAASTDTPSVGNSGVRSKQILLLTQPIYYKYYSILIEFLAVFCSQNGYSLAIKYHPRQVGNEYDSAISKIDDTCQVDIYKSESLDTIVQSSLVAISVVSAAILRCLNLGVPTVSYLPKSEKYLDLYYTDENNLFVVSDVSELEELLSYMTNDSASFFEEFNRKLRHYVNAHCVFEPLNDPSDNVSSIISKDL